MIISLSLIGMRQEAQAQVPQNFTLGEGSDTLRVGIIDRVVVDRGGLTAHTINLVTNGTFDSATKRLVFSSDSSINARAIIIDMNATLGDLQGIITAGQDGFLNYDVSSLPTRNGNTDIYIFFGDMLIDDSDRVGPGTVIQLVENGNPRGSVANPSFLSSLIGSLSTSSIGLVIEFNTPVMIDGRHSIAVDFSTTLGPPGLIPIPPGLTQQQQVALLAVRNLALEQQNFQIDYWSDPTNPFADDRVMAQDRLSNANYHISITTLQRDSLQAHLDGLTG